MDFQNKTVLVTGGASGIAFLTAKIVIDAGGNAVLVDIDADALERAKAEIGADDSRILCCQADVTDYEQVVAARDKAVEKFGSIDFLLPAAGGAEARLCHTKGPFHHNPIDVVDFGLDLNLKGAIYFCHAVLQQMEKQKSGVIVVMGSVTGREGSASNIAYSASKSALMNGVVKSLALAGAPFGARAVCVAPGPVLTRAAMANMKTLCGRAAETQEVVDLIMYLFSDKAAFINGSTIHFDGGRGVMVNKN